MVNVIAYIIGAIITFPFIGWYLIYFFTKMMTKRRAYSVKIASDISAIFFIIAVNFMLYEIWHRSYLWLIAIVILSIAIIYTILYWKMAHDVHIWKLFRGIWRFNFLLFFFIYIVVAFYGCYVRIIL